MKYLRRMVWYIAGRLFFVSTLLSLFIVVFYYSMNASDIYIVLKDGMAKRAQVIMLDEKSNDLNKYFQPAFIERDEALQIAISGSSPYTWYKVRGIDHRIELKWLWSWPWDNTATVDFIERIPHIDGNVLAQYREVVVDQNGEEALYPPKWQAGKYKAVMIHENGRWLVKSITRDNSWNEP